MADFKDYSGLTGVSGKNFPRTPTVIVPRGGLRGGYTQPRGRMQGIPEYENGGGEVAQLRRELREVKRQLGTAVGGDPGSVTLADYERGDTISNSRKCRVGKGGYVHSEIVTVDAGAVAGTTFDVEFTADGDLGRMTGTYLQRLACIGSDELADPDELQKITMELLIQDGQVPQVWNTPLDLFARDLDGRYQWLRVDEPIPFDSSVIIRCTVDETLTTVDTATLRFRAVCGDGSVYAVPR